MGISITRHALAMRVSREFNKSQDTLNRQEIDVAQTTDSMSGLTPVTGLSSDSSSLDAKTGRPKGSTDTKKREETKRLHDCINSIAHDYSIKRERLKTEHKHITRGYLAKLIATKQEEFCDVSPIAEETICSRMKQGNLNPSHPGTVSLLHTTEISLVLISIQMGKIRHTLTGPQCINLFNTLIKCTPIQKTLREFQRSRAPELKHHDTVGLDWWRAFQKGITTRS